MAFQWNFSVKFLFTSEKSVGLVAGPVQVLPEMFYFLAQHWESSTRGDEVPLMLCELLKQKQRC